MSDMLWVLLMLAAMSVVATTAWVSYGVGHADGKREAYDHIRMGTLPGPKESA